MSDPIKISVPAASTGKGIRIPTTLIGQYGDVLKEDGQEAVTFATGGLFTAIPSPDGEFVDFFAVGETGDDVATITDEDEADAIELTVVAEAPAKLEVGTATIIDRPAAAPAA